MDSCEGSSKEKWKLPEGEIKPTLDANLHEGAKRIVKEHLGMDTPYLEQVQTIGSHDRVPGQWAININYYSLISTHEDEMIENPFSSKWQKVADLNAMNTALDHDEIIEACLRRFQNKSLYTSLPIFLLPTEFTLTELQRIYEIVLGFKMEKKSFRRRLLDAGFLEETGNIRRASHRPAQLYRLAHLQPYFFARIIEGVRENRHE